MSDNVRHIEFYNLATGERERWTPNSIDVEFAQVFYKNAFLPILGHPWNFPKTVTRAWLPGKYITFDFRPIFDRYDALCHVDIMVRFGWMPNDTNRAGCAVRVALGMHEAFERVVYWPQSRHAVSGQSVAFLYTVWTW